MDVMGVNLSINYLKEKLCKDIENEILNKLNLKAGDKFYFKCNGSGYYLKFNRVERESLIFDIESKGGKVKNKIFRIHWCNAMSLRRL